MQAGRLHHESNLQADACTMGQLAGGTPAVQRRYNTSEAKGELEQVGAVFAVVLLIRKFHNR